MGQQIESATGNARNGLEIDSTNRALTRSITQTETQLAVSDGRAWNINTGLISIAATTDLLYFKYTGTTGFWIDAIAIGQGNGATSDIGEIYTTKNPTGGTVISSAVAADVIENRNYGSNKTLDATIYKGATGETLTGDSDTALFMMTEPGRLFASVDFYLPQGTSIGIRLNPNLSSGTMNVYAAIIGRVEA
jgi:hypothetical protein